MSHPDCIKIARIGIIGLGMTLMNSWVLFEEVIVDRQGLSRWMPLYKVGEPCTWDLAAAILIFLFGARIWKRIGQLKCCQNLIDR